MQIKKKMRLWKKFSIIFLNWIYYNNIIICNDIMGLVTPTWLENQKSQVKFGARCKRFRLENSWVWKAFTPQEKTWDFFLIFFQVKSIWRLHLEKKLEKFFVYFFQVKSIWRLQTHAHTKRYSVAHYTYTPSAYERIK